MGDWPRMLKAREVCSSIQDEWKFAVTTISTSWQGLLETCQQRESTYGTSFTPFQSGEKSGRRGGMLTVNIQDKGGEEFFKSKRAKGNSSVFRISQKEWALLVSPAVSLTVRFSASLTAHHCPARQSAHGTAPAVTDPSTLTNHPMVCFSELFLDLPHPSPSLKGSTPPSPGWSRNSFKAMLRMHCYAPPHFQLIKSRWNKYLQ